MTKARAGELALNVLLTVVGSMAVLVLSGAWSLKEDKAAHDRDVYELRALQQRTLDAICDVAQKQPRACQP